MLRNKRAPQNAYSVFVAVKKSPEILDYVTGGAGVVLCALPLELIGVTAFPHLLSHREKCRGNGTEEKKFRLSNNCLGI